MHLSHIVQYTIQNRNVHFPILGGTLLDIVQVQCGFMTSIYYESSGSKLQSGEMQFWTTY